LRVPRHHAAALARSQLFAALDRLLERGDEFGNARRHCDAGVPLRGAFAEPVPHRRVAEGTAPCDGVLPPLAVDLADDDHLAADELLARDERGVLDSELLEVGIRGPVLRRERATA